MPDKACSIFYPEKLSRKAQLFDHSELAPRGQAGLLHLLRFRAIKVIMRLRGPCRALMTAHSLSGRTVTAGNLFIAPLSALRLKLLTFGSAEKSIVNTDKVTRVITTELKLSLIHI